jgi:hypothetical protein
VVGNKVWKIRMASFDDTNKSTIFRGESNIHQNVVDSNFPGINLTDQDMFLMFATIVYSTETAT